MLILVCSLTILSNENRLRLTHLSHYLISPLHRNLSAPLSGPLPVALPIPTCISIPNPTLNPAN